jgi:hypothetical protein
MSWELFTSIVDQIPKLSRAVLHGVGEPMLVKDCQMCGGPIPRSYGERANKYWRQRHCSVECRDLMDRLRNDRLPFGPLYDYLSSSHITDTHRDGLTHDEVAVLIGETRTSVARWVLDGLSPMQADRVAIRLGWHPAWIWPEWVTACLEVV